MSKLPINELQRFARCRAALVILSPFTVYMVTG
jgi:hypothetical protein